MERKELGKGSCSAKNPWTAGLHMNIKNFKLQCSFEEHRQNFCT